MRFSKKLESNSFGNDMQVVGDLKELQRKLGEYVIFSYEKQLYPRQITKVKDNGAVINAMKKSLKTWKWPQKKDELFYHWKVVIGGIDPPKQISKRGLFSVPQLDKLWWQQRCYPIT